MINERQETILKLTKSNGNVTVKKLAHELYVSEMTVRRDLTVLENEGLIKRYRGGAVPDSGDAPINVRFFEQDEIKKELAREADKYISDNSMIFLDSSSTVSYLVPYIARHKDVSVVTNSVQNLLLLAENGIGVFLIGGDYNRKDMCTFGMEAVNTAEKFNVDTAFFSVYGYSENGIILESDPLQFYVRQSIMKNSAMNVFLLDKTKRDKKCRYNYKLTCENSVFIEK